MISFERGTVVIYLLTIIYPSKKVKVETFKNSLEKSVVKSGFLSHLGKQTRKGGLVNDK